MPLINKVALDQPEKFRIGLNLLNQTVTHYSPKQKLALSAFGVLLIAKVSEKS